MGDGELPLGSRSILYVGFLQSYLLRGFGCIDNKEFFTNWLRAISGSADRESGNFPSRGSLMVRFSI